MPIYAIYEYECLKCGKKFQLRQSIDGGEKDIACPCPHCGDRDVRRVTSACARISPT